MGQQVSEKIKYTLLCVGLASVLTEWNETICGGALCMIAAFAKIAKFAIFAKMGKSYACLRWVVKLNAGSTLAARR